MIKSAISHLMKLSTPILFGFLGNHLITVGDIFIAAKHSTLMVGAIGVANGSINPFLHFGLGLVMGISSVLAFQRGQTKKVENKFSDVFIYSVLVGILSSALCFCFNNFLIQFLNLQSDMMRLIQNYNNIIIYSFPFAVAFNGLKEYLQSKESVIFPNVLMILAIGLNIVLNYLLVFGFSEFPGLNEKGLAYSSLGLRFLLLVILFIYIWKKEEFKKVNFQSVKFQFNFNFPISLTYTLEIAAFCMVGTFTGKLGPLAAATNNIIISICSTTFMIPTALGSATAVMVGYHYGAKNYRMLKLYLKAAVILNFSFTLITIATYLIFPETIISLLTSDKKIIIAGISLIQIVAIFQYMDNFQVLLLGIQRGFKRTKVPAIIVLSSHWLIGVPLGFYLVFKLDFGVRGFWIGLATALSLIFFNLLIYFRYFTLVKVKEQLRVN